MPDKALANARLWQTGVRHAEGTAAGAGDGSSSITRGRSVLGLQPACVSRSPTRTWVIPELRFKYFSKDFPKFDVDTAPARTPTTYPEVRFKYFCGSKAAPCW